LARWRASKKPTPVLRIAEMLSGPELADTKLRSRAGLVLKSALRAIAANGGASVVVRLGSTLKFPCGGGIVHA
jgi:hypothetical protein